MEIFKDRRTFLGLTFAGLIAGPFAARYFCGRQTSLKPREFSREFQKYSKLVDISVRPADGPERFALKIAPPEASNLKYVIFFPALMAGPLSQATSNEPDGFYVREGRLAVQQTDRKQTILYGGDDVAKFFFPTSCVERNRNAVTLLAQDGRLYQARAKGQVSTASRDSQLSNLLTLAQLPNKELRVGTKWATNIGRVRPFHGIKTNYEIVCFSEIAGRKTVNVRFNGAIANAATLPGVREDRAGSGEVMKNTHSGNAWFDLETGLLTRQETEMVTELKGVPGLDKPLTVTGNFVVQLFTV